MSSFEDVNIENLHNCGESSSGLKTRLYYAPSAFFFFTPLPKSDDSFESEIIIPDEILMRSGKHLKYIDVLIDESEIKTSLTGGVGRKKIKASLSFFILGMKADILGFLERCINAPIIFFIKDSNDNLWQIGHINNPAYFESADTTSGKKYEENSGTAISVGCNSKVFLYPHSLDNIAIPGDFNNDFNNDFYLKEYE